MREEPRFAPTAANQVRSNPNGSGYSILARNRGNDLDRKQYIFTLLAFPCISHQHRRKSVRIAKDWGLPTLHRGTACRDTSSPRRKGSARDSVRCAPATGDRGRMRVDSFCRVSLRDRSNFIRCYFQETSLQHCRGIIKVTHEGKGPQRALQGGR